MATTRETILSAADLAREAVTVPEWGGVTVYLHELDALARLAFDDESAALKAAGTKESGVESAARYLVAALREADGTPVFEAGDLPRLIRKNPKVLVRLFKRAAELSAIGEKEISAEAGKSEGPRPVEPSGG